MFRLLPPVPVHVFPDSKEVAERKLSLYFHFIGGHLNNLLRYQVEKKRLMSEAYSNPGLVSDSKFAYEWACKNSSQRHVVRNLLKDDVWKKLWILSWPQDSIYFLKEEVAA